MSPMVGAAGGVRDSRSRVQRGAVERVVCACTAWWRQHGEAMPEQELASFLARREGQPLETTRNALTLARGQGLLRGTRPTLDGEALALGPEGEVWRASGRRAG